MSERLDVSRQTVSRWETGNSRPSTEENLQALCKLYNVKLADLLDKSNEETLIEKPECQKVKCDIERKDKEKRHVWAKRGVIAAMIRLWRFAIFLGDMVRKNFLDLHEIQGEENTPHELPEFNLDWS